MTILELTEERLRAQAREAAEQHIPMEQANHHEPHTNLWREFNGAYYAACRERDRSDANATGGCRVEERIYGTNWRATCIS